MKSRESVRDSFPNWSSALILSLACVVWMLLSQVALIPWGKSQIFLGPDGALDFLEDQTINARFSLRGEIPSPLNVIYVNVDSTALETLGNFPWSREVFAVTLDALFKRGGIRAAGIDFVFSASGLPQLGRAEAEEGSLKLGKAVREHQNVVLAAAFASERREGSELGSFPYIFDPGRGGGLPELPGFPVVGPTWGHMGLINTVGGGARFVPFFATTEGHTYYPMSLELALIHWGLDASNVQIGKREMTVTDRDGRRLATIPLILGQLAEPNWFSAWDQNLQCSIVDVLAQDRLAREGTEEEKAQAAEFFEGFKDAIVLIGPTDPLLKDISRLPLSGGQEVPRVSLHGNLLKMLVSGREMIRPPVWVNLLIIAALGWLCGGFCMVKARFCQPLKIASIIAALGYLAFAFWTFSEWNLVLPVVAPMGAAASCLFLGTILQLANEQRQKRRIQDLFGSYVSSAVVAEMVEKNIAPQTGGSEVEITAFFSDIVSFSPIAEQLRPTDLVELMSEYLGEGTAAVMEASGTLDKYVGDAIVSIFGAPLPCPTHAAAACQAALALQASQTRLRVRWSGQGDRWPQRVLEMSSRVGLHTGMAVVGNIGSKLRFNYTMMGDTVNLAQRVEAAAGYYGAHILVSGETYQAAQRDDAQLVFRPLDRVLVSGRSQPVDLYELLGRGPEVETDTARRRAAYAEAREIYRRGNWEEAEKAFLQACEWEANPEGKNPSRAMAARCAQLIGKPPVEDFVFFVGK